MFPAARDRQAKYGFLTTVRKGLSLDKTPAFCRLFVVSTISPKLYMIRFKSIVVFIRYFALVIGLMFATNMARAEILKFFTDSWQQTASNNMQITTGSFTANFSLPLDGVDLSEVDSNSQFSFGVNGPFVAGSMSSAENYVAGQTSATFALITNDINGDTVTNGSVTVSWTATNITVAAAVSADLLGIAQLTSGNINDSPKHDGLSISPWEVILTLDASDNGGGTFNYDNDSLIASGWELGKEYKIPDSTNSFDLETGSLTSELTFTPPAITIADPPSDFKVYNPSPVINLEGKATASFGLANIECYVNGDATNFVPVNYNQDTETTWTAQVDLSIYGQVGSNLVTVVALDAMGYQTGVSRTFFWVETNRAVVTVNPPGAGTVIGIRNGQVLQVGNSYRVSAVPTSADWVLSNFTSSSGEILWAPGGVTSPGGSTVGSGPPFYYVDTDGTLTANFVRKTLDNGSPLGTYTGLFYDTNGVQLDDAGYITMTVKDTGNFSGKLYLATMAAPLSFSGQLGQIGPGVSTAEFHIKADKSEYLQLILSLLTPSDSSDYASGSLTGSVNAFSDVTETNLIDSAEISAELSLDLPYAFTEVYNMFVDPGYTDPSQGPGGKGWARVTIGKQEAATVVLTLPDGASPAISFDTAVASDGTCPIYASLYGGKGVIMGWLQFDGSSVTSLSNLVWIKTPVADKFYPLGFTNYPSMAGSPYFPPKPGTNLFGTTALTFTVDPGYTNLSLPDEADTFVAFNPVKKTFSDTNKVAVMLAPLTGALTGSFYPAGSKTSLSFHGLEVGGGGYGFYIDATKHQTGPILFRALSPGSEGQDQYSGGDSSSSGAINISVSAPVSPPIPLTAVPPSP